MGKLQDKIALITGGASGIGRGCAELFAREGAKVIIADVQDESGQAVAQAVDGLYLHVDVSDPQGVDSMIRQTVETYGRLDILVNNAGIDGQYAPTGDSTIENWRKVMSINMDGVYYGLKYALPVMVAQGGGVILNMASIFGLVGLVNLPPYTAAKAGVIQLSKAAAIEYAPHNIRVNALCPSVVDTPLIRHFIAHSPDSEAIQRQLEQTNPLPGMITIEAVAQAALFLVSDESAFITGIALPIDGGYTAR